MKTVEAGRTYEVTLKSVTNEGIKETGKTEIKFCKGAKDDEKIPRQEGIFVEDLLEVGLDYLKSVNVGELKDAASSEAIRRIEKALAALAARKAKRQKAGVHQTYKPA